MLVSKNVFTTQRNYTVKPFESYRLILILSKYMITVCVLWITNIELIILQSFYTQMIRIQIKLSLNKQGQEVRSVPSIIPFFKR